MRLKLLDTSDIQDRYQQQIDAQMQELAFGKADETMNIDRYQDRAKAGEVDTAMEEGLSRTKRTGKKRCLQSSS
jgi:hypothetical protein